MTELPYLTDLRNGKTLTTVHVATGLRRDHQWHPETETVLIHTTLRDEVGTKTERESWVIGTLQLPMAKNSTAFQTNF